MSYNKYAMDRNLARTVTVVVLLTLILLGMVGCNLLDFLPKNEIQLLQSGKPRNTSPNVGAAELEELVTGNTAFAFELYQALRQKEGNLFYSPYSISIALAMTYAGAREETERQMSKTLHFTLPRERLHPAFNALDLELASRGKGVVGKDGRPFRLNIANSIWGQIGHPFLPAFLDALAINYGAGLRLLDFASAPEASRLTINEWVSKQTEGKIRDLLSPGSITPETRLVLTNAIYFNAAWHYPFDEANTHDDVFRLLDGHQVTVPMMSQINPFGYAEGDGYQAVELPYRGKDQWTVELSMVILLPQPGRFEEFERSLDAERVGAILGALQPREVELTMPKFTYESSFSLKEELEAMGMPDAFSGSADFSGIDGSRDLFIGDIVHKAFISVDEAGTEAAAATAVLMVTLAPPPPVVVMIDRPFIFMIRDIKTGAIIFLGRVINPGA
jgi:serpin B